MAAGTGERGANSSYRARNPLGRSLATIRPSPAHESPDQGLLVPVVAPHGSVRADWLIGLDLVTNPESGQTRGTGSGTASRLPSVPSNRKPIVARMTGTRRALRNNNTRRTGPNLGGRSASLRKTPRVRWRPGDPGWCGSTQFLFPAMIKSGTPEADARLYCSFGVGMCSRYILPGVPVPPRTMVP